MCSTVEAGFQDASSPAASTTKQKSDATKIIDALAIGLEVANVYSSGTTIDTSATTAAKLAAAHSFCAYYVRPRGARVDRAVGRLTTRPCLHPLQQNAKDVVTELTVTPLEGGVPEMNAQLFSEWYAEGEWGGGSSPGRQPRPTSATDHDQHHEAHRHHQHHRRRHQLKPTSCASRNLPPDPTHAPPPGTASRSPA